jgi:coenzyme F420-reducing hydrogenase delta subunit
MKEKDHIPEMARESEHTLAIFYCQNTPGATGRERQSLEEKYGNALRLFPIPCSGRLEPLHLLRALEEFCDVAYVITCPEGACRYFEGNRRAAKRVKRTQSIIASIGLEEERLGIVVRSRESQSLAVVAAEILEEISQLGPSPVQMKRRPQLPLPSRGEG